MLLMSASFAEAACTNAGGVPFSCAPGTTPATSDVLLAGANTGAQTGETVKYTVAQEFSLLLAQANSWAATQTFGGNIVFNSGWSGNVNLGSTIFTGTFVIAGGIGSSGLEIGTSPATFPGGTIFINAGAAGAGTNLNGGPMLIQSGTATGNGNSSVQIYASGGGSSGTAASPDPLVATANWYAFTAAVPVQLPVFTVSTLPTCNGTLVASMAAVSDATSPTYNGTLTGGGAVSIPVYCNGTAWTAH
jgi:hypothetical protein